MATLQDRFKSVFDRDPSDKEWRSLNTFLKQNNLKESDALLNWILFEERNIQRLEAIPAAIIEASKIAQKSAAAELKTIQANSAKDAIPLLVAAVDAQVTKLSAKNVEIEQDHVITRKWQWIAGCVSGSLIAVSLSLSVMHDRGQDSGYRAGYGAGYAEAKDEKAAAAWANTPEGKLAYAFSQNGELQRLARCQGKCWKIEKGICYPTTTAEGQTFGWAIP